jgi:ankyrin repeat protein
VKFLLNMLALATLLVAGCSRHVPRADLDQQLLTAAQRGDASAVRQWLHEGANVDATDANGSTALMLASEQGNLALVNLLLEQNANIRVVDKYGDTALVIAARDGDSEIFRGLLAQTPDAHDLQQGLLAVSVSGPVGVIQLSHAEAATPKPQEQTSDPPEVVIMKLLLDRNVSIDTRDEEGSTPLILASSHGQIEMVRLLLDRGAQVDAKDNYGNTALIAAACACAQATMLPTHDILGLLLDKGANINAQSKDGSTALMKAATGYETENAELLVKRGANLRI